ncbi:hypothetical protein [Acinetobacter wuhouensis]|uniref:Uncharacterized protein n=1 Tax=Acinetobacter wuhouensis TaxID=1879050 RepID=A0A4Q7AJH7_9GAMM|nr:hypothetical protein [Acinetobacter wuhouensis]RZG45831.1 hypothetical protein EXU28_11480 [Acinetobacter wuhouensis]
MKNKNPVVMIIIGIVLFLIGGGLYFTSSKPNISAEDQARCESLVQQKYGESSSSIIGSCKTDTGFVAMMDAQAGGATSAEATAKAISSANNQELGLGFFGKFLTGLCVGIGIAMIIKGFIALRNKANPTA